MQEDQVGLFDLDGSLADYDAQLLKDLNLLKAPEEPLLVDLWNEDKKPHIAARMNLIKSQPDWWFNLSPIPDGIKVFEAAHDIGFDNHILTKGPKSHPNAWTEKFRWCMRHLSPTIGEMPVTITSDKKLVYGKFLYDDWPAYCKRWLKHRKRGLVIMPDRPYNRDFKHPQALRWTGENFDEVVHALRVCLARKDGEPLIL